MSWSDNKRTIIPSDYKIKLYLKKYIIFIDIHYNIWFYLNVKNPSTTCGSLGGAEKPGDDLCCSEAKAQLNRNGEGPTEPRKKKM